MKNLRSILLALCIAPALMAAEPEVEHLKFDKHACKQPAHDPAVSSSEQRKIVPPRAGPAHPLISPNVPQGTVKEGEKATVVLDLLVTEEGWISEARVAKPSGWPVVDRAAMEVTEKWRLRPGTIDDEPTCMWMKFTVTSLGPRTVR